MADREHIEQTASHFIAQRESGPWGEQQAAELERWLAQSTFHRVAYYRLNAAWQEAGRLKALGSTEVHAEQWSEALNEPKPSLTLKSSNRRRTAWAAAAGFALVIGGSLAAFYISQSRFNSYSTVVGGLESVPMADGSKIILNTDSALRVFMSDQERRIELAKGEAFFEVAKDPNRPFVVNAGARRIVAVGTRFSVRREGSDVRVGVTEGAVRMEPQVRAQDGKHDSQAVLLSAGATARTDAGKIMVEDLSVPQVEQSLTWRSGILSFHDTPLAQAAAEFNRYNTRKIVIEDAAVGALQVGGVFGATTLDPFVRLLESAFPVTVSEQGQRILIRAR